LESAVNPKGPPATTREASRNQSRREHFPAFTRSSDNDYARVPTCITSGSCAA
jgi:hypothetical protein